MMDKSVEGVLGMSMEKIKEMVDVNTVIGSPITIDNLTLIPVSRVTYGFAGGGFGYGLLLGGIAGIALASVFI